MVYAKGPWQLRKSGPEPKSPYSHCPPHQCNSFSLAITIEFLEWITASAKCCELKGAMEGMANSRYKMRQNMGRTVHSAWCRGGAPIPTPSPVEVCRRKPQVFESLSFLQVSGRELMDNSCFFFQSLFSSSIRSLDVQVSPGRAP